MSKITRRDFLKTAGVMTLAVAAAGVLSGCEGNTVPEKPVTGNKQLGDVVKIGDIDFSITKAAIVQMPGKFNENTGVQGEPSDRAIALLLTCKNTNATTAKTLDTANLTFYVNGVAVKSSDYKALTSINAKYTAEKVLGDKKAAVLDGNEQYAFDTKNAVSRYVAFSAPAYNNNEGFKDVTSLQAVYYNAEKKTHYVYDIEVPAVVDYKAD